MSPLLELAEDTRRVMERFYTRERVVEMIGDDGEVVWKPYTGQSIAGDYAWSCNIEDMAPESKEQRVQKAMLQAQAFAPFAGLVNMKPVLKNLAEALEFDGLEFLPQPNALPKTPGDEWIVMLRKGDTVVPMEQEDHAWHLEVHTLQLQSQEAENNPAATQLLNNHVEHHTMLIQAQQLNIQGQQQAQQKQGGGTPGAPLGSNNNISGGGGVFAGGDLQGLQQQGAPLQGLGNFLGGA